MASSPCIGAASRDQAGRRQPPSYPNSIGSRRRPGRRNSSAKPDSVRTMSEGYNTRPILLPIFFIVMRLIAVFAGMWLYYPTFLLGMGMFVAGFLFSILLEQGRVRAPQRGWPPGVRFLLAIGALEDAARPERLHSSSTAA